ncbi:SDR family oxidoreductase [Gordonia sp. CPCC 205333]|uniref:SDR family oxidoreductase n=1 Tax=Gordonia sp. CPCC 205333 TaxID=3140790 RepID=UPI003AF38BEA
MFLVTGATGAVGRRVVDQLLGAGRTVRATSRTPADAGLPDEVEVVDSAAPADQLLSGCRSILLVAPALGNSPIVRLAELMAKARTAGIERLVQVSTASAADTLSPTGAYHRALEDGTVDFSGRRYILRPVPFALNTAHWWAPTIKTDRVAEGPYLDAPTAPIDERDVADVATALLTGSELTSDTLNLTGPQHVSPRQQLQVLARLLDVDLTVRELPADDVRTRMADVGIPAAAIDSLLRSFEFAMEYGVELTLTVETVLGRPARSYRDWARDHRGLFG